MTDQRLLASIRKLGESTVTFRALLAEAGRTHWFASAALETNSEILERERGSPREDDGTERGSAPPPLSDAELADLQGRIDKARTVLAEVQRSVDDGDLRTRYDQVIENHAEFVDRLRQWPVASLAPPNPLPDQIDEFVEVLGEWLQAHKATQAEAAARFGVSQATVSRYTNVSRGLDGPRIRKILQTWEQPWLLDTELRQEIRQGATGAARLLRELGYDDPVEADDAARRRLARAVNESTLTGSQSQILRRLVDMPDLIDALARWAEQPDPLERIRAELSRRD